MKKISALILAILMLCGAALAEDVELGMYEGFFMKEGEYLTLDLDGDGVPEDVIVRREGPVDEEYISLYIYCEDNTFYKYDTILSYTTALLVDDMNLDGKMEIMVSGDIYSDDYCTWCFNFDRENGITPLTFADAGRGENTDEYYEYGYGRITAMYGTELTLTGSQDVLGTWMASRKFELRDGRFEFADDGLWVMEDWTQDEEMWDYFCLIPTRSIPVTFEDGSEGSLGLSDRFMVMKSDKESIVYFQTIKGWKGSFEIQPDPQGWGSIIDGESEETLFEYVPYAD